jgi:hypothetical protein
MKQEITEAAINKWWDSYSISAQVSISEKHGLTRRQLVEDLSKMELIYLKEQENKEVSNVSDGLREQAIKWWNSLSILNMEEYFEGYKEYTPAFDHTHLTGREIQNIWANLYLNGGMKKQFRNVIHSETDEEQIQWIYSCEQGKKRQEEPVSVLVDVDNRFYDEAKKEYPLDRIKSAIFEQGAKYGANWQKEQDEQEMEKLKLIVSGERKMTDKAIKQSSQDKELIRELLEALKDMCGRLEWEESNYIPSVNFHKAQSAIEKANNYLKC